MNRIKQLIREYASYLFFGILTTLVNYIVYFLCIDVLMLHYTISNVLAFIVAVTFAFFTNKHFVFGSNTSFRWKELGSFVSLRILSLLVEMGCLIIGVEWFLFDDGSTKIVVSILTVILNYVFGKYITFAKKEDTSWI